jgi:hypothetical protein
MPTATLQEVAQLAETLPNPDKLALVDRLLKSMRQEVTVNQVQVGSDLAMPDQPPVVAKANGSVAPPREFSDAPDPQRKRELQWIEAHRADYAGQYVAIEDDFVICHGTDGRQVLDEAYRAGVKIPFVVRVEAADEPPFGGW